MGPDKRPEPVCTGCEFVFYLNQKVVAGTIPESDGRILLTRRAIHPSYGKWTFPGGYVDWGEPVEAAAVRETWEETGLRVELGRAGRGLLLSARSPIVIVVYRAARHRRHADHLPRERSRGVGGAGGHPVGGAGLSVHRCAALREFLSGRTV